MATDGSSPISQIALSLLIGFTLMLILEQYFTPHMINPTLSNPQLDQTSQRPRPVETFQMLDETHIETPCTIRTNSEARNESRPPVQVMTYPLTLGLVIHSLADGLALGASASGENSSDTSLSLVVFIALIIHKCLPLKFFFLFIIKTYISVAPTALALTSSLLSTSLPRSDIRKHVAVFSVATPVGALVSFLLLGFIGAHVGNWTGIALLLSVSFWLSPLLTIDSEPLLLYNRAAPFSM